jgi:hypothetical protein
MEGAAFAQITQVLDDTTNRVNTLEQTLMRDLAVAIDKLVCAGNLLLNQSLADALGGFGKLIGANEIEISAPLLYDNEAHFFAITISVGLKNFSDCDPLCDNLP